MAETFAFEDNLSVGPPGQLAKYRPNPGEVVVEVYSATGVLLNMDSFKANIEAPRNSCYVSQNMFEEPYDRENGVVATYTSLHDAVGTALLQWECVIGQLCLMPFDVPQYITNKQGAHSVKLWWGSKGLAK